VEWTVDQAPPREGIIFQLVRRAAQVERYTSRILRIMYGPNLIRQDLLVQWLMMSAGDIDTYVANNPQLALYPLYWEAWKVARGSAHPTYAGRLPLSLQARLIRGGKGVSGANLDYLMSTVRHLNALGIRERELERLVTIAGPLAWTRSRAQHTSPYAAALARVLQRRPPPVRLPRGTERGQFLFRQRIGT